MPQVPYSSYVETMSYKQQPDGSIRIEQTIFVETAGQKKILVGMIKDLGIKARSEMIKFLGCNVHLFLEVVSSSSPPADGLRLARSRLHLA
jgi:GTPase